VLADIMDSLSFRSQVMRHDIRPMYSEARVVGRAATMLAADVEEIPRHPYELELALLDDLRPGEVVVCSTQGSRRCAVWGELLSTHARARGARGAVLDALTRDLEAITAMRFPVFAVGCGAADAKGRTEVTAIRTTLDVGGVTVRDGDLIVADLDGCVTVPAQAEDEVVRRAFEKVSEENRVREVLARGASIRAVFREYGVL
jgi:4-hydroxy-4-methyl-2-oxoglutarate aldolase